MPAAMGHGSDSNSNGHSHGYGRGVDVAAALTRAVKAMRYAMCHAPCQCSSLAHLFAQSPLRPQVLAPGVGTLSTDRGLDVWMLHAGLAPCTLPASPAILGAAAPRALIGWTQPLSSIHSPSSSLLLPMLMLDEPNARRPVGGMDDCQRLCSPHPRLLPAGPVAGYWAALRSCAFSLSSRI